MNYSLLTGTTELNVYHTHCTKNSTRVIIIFPNCSSDNINNNSMDILLCKHSIQ